MTPDEFIEELKRLNQDVYVRVFKDGNWLVAWTIPQPRTEHRLRRSREALSMPDFPRKFILTTIDRDYVVLREYELEVSE